MFSIVRRHRRHDVPVLRLYCYDRVYVFQISPLLPRVIYNPSVLMYLFFSAVMKLLREEKKNHDLSFLLLQTFRQIRKKVCHRKDSSQSVQSFLESFFFLCVDFHSLTAQN